MSGFYRWTNDLMQQPGDAAGRRWYVAQWHDHVARVIEARVEALTRAAVRAGGIAVPPAAYDLTGSVATITGDAVGVTGDGYAVVYLPPGANTLDLSLADSLPDGTHTLVLEALTALDQITFDTPDVPIRDAQGVIVEQVDGQTLTYGARARLGGVDIQEGWPVSGTSFVPLATVDKSGTTWSNLTPVWQRPVYHADDARIIDAAGNTTVAAGMAGALLRVTGAATITLPDDLRRNLRLRVMNDTASDAVSLATSGSASLESRGGLSGVINRGVVEVVSVGSGAWRAYGDLE